jgi:hypothetical protein
VDMACRVTPHSVPHSLNHSLLAHLLTHVLTQLTHSTHSLPGLTKLVSQLTREGNWQKGLEVGVASKQT